MFSHILIIQSLFHLCTVCFLKITLLVTFWSRIFIFGGFSQMSWPLTSYLYLKSVAEELLRNSLYEGRTCWLMDFVESRCIREWPSFSFLSLLSFISSFLPFPSLSFFSFSSFFPHSLFLPDWETRTSVSADLFSKTLQLIQRKIFWSPALRRAWLLVG